MTARAHAPWLRHRVRAATTAVVAALLAAIGARGETDGGPRGAAPAPAATGEPAVARTFLTVTTPDPATTVSIRHWCTTRHAGMTARLVRVDVATGGPGDARGDAGSPGSTGASVDLRSDVAALVYEIPGAGRFVHDVEVTGLAPDATYAFTLRDSDRQVGARRTFTTLPTRGPVRFAVGGDVEIDADAAALGRILVARGARLLVLGGDLAYENGDPRGASFVDRFVDLIATATTSDAGGMIPVVAALGNHETSVWMDLGRAPRALTGAPFYDALFLRRSADDAPDRPTWRALVVSDTATLLLLDSGHVNPHAGAQATWLGGALRSMTTPHAIAIYHVPLYPSVRPLADLQAAAGRAAWEPLFDALGVDAAFEHHDHALKRTRPLRAGRVDDDDGVVYFGDGGFGKLPRQLRRDLDPRFLTALAAEHVWIVDARRDGLAARATAPDGSVLDEAFVRRGPTRRDP